ncbi:Lipase chaperone [Vibrio mediterranei]|uniref:lipase secretion chaperone n=1 Tax=Vibrio mediterranei TaxID=689 RepID=UPI000781A96E|nr:lipase secretion chaperone [Vibrio mediterranei]MCG9656197.1 lipase chaperone [Vibrio mediterranei]MCG9664121.1 lipase chaperone [Vibrio mediterranei]PTC06420.1 lipase chaperone [Vibrio mediterranei]SBO09000.1 Lipase chaperone [Vibrio mediterranei]
MNRFSKTTAVMALLVVIAAGLFSVFDADDHDSLKVSSQLDTQIDNASERDTFEYFISGLVDNDTDTIEQRFEHYSQQRDGSEQLEPELFEKYMRYKAALAALKRNGDEATNFQDLHQQILLMQSEFFTADEQERLFGEENLLRELALTKKAIKESAQTPEEYQQRWENELNQLSPELQNSFRNATVLTALNDTNAMDTQSQYIAREALVGSEAAERLMTLDQKRADFDQQFDSYLVARADILNNASFNDAEKAQAINDLREPLFDKNQWRRIEALERIHDGQGE